MSKKYVLIGVEGNQDQAFIGRTLKVVFGLEKFNGRYSEMDKFWERTKFVDLNPKLNKEDIYKRLDIPSIYSNEHISIGIYVAEGKDQLIEKLTKRLQYIDEKFSTLIIVVDADKKSVEDTRKDCETGLKELKDNQDLWDNIEGSDNPLKIYVLPNNFDTGVVETLLLKCGDIAYPTYLERAKEYINQISKEEQKQLKWKPFDEEKAIIATVASVLKPGKTNTVSIIDNEWVSEITYQQVEDLSKFVIFLQESLGIEPIITVEK